MKKILIGCLLFHFAYADEGPAAYPDESYQYSGDTTLVQYGQHDINPGYTNGRRDIDRQYVPTLSDIENMELPKQPKLGKKQKGRLPGIKEAAVSYGAQSGLAWASKEIDRDVEKHADQLSKIYNFNFFAIRDHGQIILPPVIVSQDNMWQENGDDMIRVADKYYKIEREAMFAPVAPIWQTYLRRNYNIPNPPNRRSMPKDKEERMIWMESVAYGWGRGVQQAREIFRTDLNRLNRDYNGTILYSRLLNQGKVSKPIVAGANLGVTGGGESMRINDKLYRLTSRPQLTPPTVWHPRTMIAPYKNQESQEYNRSVPAYMMIHSPR